MGGTGVDVVGPTLGAALVTHLLVLALFGLPWLLFAVPVLRGAAHGLRSGDWWTPFERRPHGTWPRLVAGRTLAGLRAPEGSHPRTRAGLLVRWAVPMVVTLLLPLGVSSLVVATVQPLAGRWRAAAGRGTAPVGSSTDALGVEGVLLIVASVAGLLAVGFLVPRVLRFLLPGGRDRARAGVPADGTVEPSVPAPTDLDGTPDRVVLRAPLWALVPGVPLLAVLWVGVVLGLVGLVRDGAGEATPWPAAVAAWVLVPLLVLVLPVTGWFLVTYRLDLDGAGGRVRRSPGGVDIGVDELEALVVLEPSVVGRAQRGWRLQLRHPVRGVVAQVEESDRGWARALGVARRWARERPELVRDEVTRRVLAPTPID